MVSPWFYSLFKNSLTEILTNNVDMVERGIFGMYNGAFVKMSNNIYKDGDADCIAVMTKDAIAYADGIEEVEAYRPVFHRVAQASRHSGWLLRSRGSRGAGFGSCRRWAQD